MKTITLTVLGAAALAGVATIAVAPVALADGGGWGRQGGGFGGPMGMMSGGPGMGPAAMFEQFDADGDGKLTQAEIDAGAKSRFAEADADKQGGVTIQEFEPWFWKQHRETMVRAFQFLDRDGDGSITEEEVTVLTGKAVERMDRNGDGALTRDDRPRREGRGEGRGWGRHHGDRDGGRGDGDRGGRGWFGWGDDDMPRRGMGPGGGQGPGPGGQGGNPPPAE
jgi:Ca2+-binding EF-hand superfamily protein